MSSTNSLRSRIFTAVLLSLTAACASVTPIGRPGGELVARGAILEIANNEYADLQVYLVRGGTAIQVGHVSGLTKRVIGIPGSMLGAGDVQLMVRQRVDDAPRYSGPFMVMLGQRITWAINTNRVSDQVVVR